MTTTCRQVKGNANRMSTSPAPGARQGLKKGRKMDEEAEGRRVRGTGSKLAYETLRHEILSLVLAPGQLLD